MRQNRNKGKQKVELAVISTPYAMYYIVQWALSDDPIFSVCYYHLIGRGSLPERNRAARVCFRLFLLSFLLFCHEDRIESLGPLLKAGLYATRALVYDGLDHGADTARNAAVR